jgi:chromate transporter
MNTGSVGIVDVFVVIFVSTLFSIGGGNGPIAVMQDRWVTPGLLDPTSFAWAIALGQITPGPNAGFLAGIGYYMYGLPGALAAVAGIVLPTSIGAAAVTHWFAKLEPVIKKLSIPAGFVIGGMIAAAAWHMAAPMKLSAIEAVGVAVVAIAVGWRNLSAAIVVLGSATAGLVWWLTGISVP